VLFGKANPSGKLPFTYPRTTGDIHVPYWHWYSDVTTPLFPFGFGLSYTSTASPSRASILNTLTDHICVRCVVGVVRSVRL
jgi:beta-glucosidase